MSKKTTMSKTKTGKSAKSAKSAAPRLKESAAAYASSAAAQRSRNIRDTVESIAIAFILAFLFRTFEAEAFVIPTGSMAPTLQGRHKDVDCPKCGFRYRASASKEVSSDGGSLLPIQSAPVHESDEIVRITCPQCRYPMDVDPTSAAGAEAISYNGDRIIVGKFSYEFSDPERWDVIVFKFPGDANTNYIKRLVGLPGEQLRIHHGDIYRRNGDAADDDPWRIERKPPDKTLVMRQLVFDNAYVPLDLQRAGWPSRFTAEEPDAVGAWSETIDAESGPNVRQTFNVDGSADVESWVRYEHRVPDGADWEQMLRGPLPPGYPTEPRLITDFYAYNTEVQRGSLYAHRGNAGVKQLGLHWIGDLMLEADVTVEKSAGLLILDLVEAGVHFQCEIDLYDGKVKFSHGGREATSGKIDSPLGKPGQYSVRFGNVDDQLLLWVDGELIAAEPYDSPGNDRPQSTAEDAAIWPRPAWERRERRCNWTVCGSGATSTTSRSRPFHRRPLPTIRRRTIVEPVAETA